MRVDCQFNVYMDDLSSSLTLTDCKTGCLSANIMIVNHLLHADDLVLVSSLCSL